MSSAFSDNKVDFKVEAISKSQFLLELRKGRKLKVNLLTSFGTIQGQISKYDKNDQSISMNTLMNDTIIEEYQAGLELDGFDNDFVYNYLVLENVIMKPFTNPELEYIYEELVVFTDQILGFNFI